MKTLYERLSKENQSKVDNYKYNALKEMIESSLKNYYFFNDLTLGEVTTIHGCIFDNAIFDLHEFYNLFND